MAFSHILVGASTNPAQLVVRRISLSDLRYALARGIDDFTAVPSHALFLCVIYPLLGILLIGLTLGNSLLPLAFPIAAGFALVGPLAAIGLYELSRRREAGLDSSSGHALNVLHSPSLGAMMFIVGDLPDATAGRGAGFLNGSNRKGCFPSCNQIR